MAAIPLNDRMSNVLPQDPGAHTQYAIQLTTRQVANTLDTERPS